MMPGSIGTMFFDFTSSSWRIWRGSLRRLTPPSIGTGMRFARATDAPLLEGARIETQPVVGAFHHAVFHAVVDDHRAQNLKLRLRFSAVAFIGKRLNLDGLHHRPVVWIDGDA